MHTRNVPSEARQCAVLNVLTAPVVKLRPCVTLRAERSSRWPSRISTASSVHAASRHEPSRWHASPWQSARRPPLIGLCGPARMQSSYRPSPCDTPRHETRGDDNGGGGGSGATPTSTVHFCGSGVGFRPSNSSDQIAVHPKVSQKEGGGGEADLTSSAR